jgi:ketosteroid isomerase-like protein
VSQANVEIVRRGWEHFLATGSLSLEVTAPDVVWDMSAFRGWPEQPYYQGIKGMDAFIREWTEPFEDWKIEVEDYYDAGDDVVTVCRQVGRARASGADVEMRYAVISTVHEGLQTRWKAYADPGEALKAVGLQE